jgi:hypothetical protein
MDIRLEGFDTQIRGHRVLVIGGVEQWIARMALLESEALYKGKSILVIQDKGEINPLLLRRKWDSIYRLKDSFDAQMIATYVANCPKPARILWIYGQGQEIPRVIWSKWAKGDITLVGGQSIRVGAIGGVEWEAIYFPYEAEQEVLEKVLHSRATGAGNELTKIKQHMADITSSGAALVWTNIEEKGIGGKLYWYDPQEGLSGEEAYTNKEASEILKSISKWIERE